jgi:outer membrane protein OmpA-like peptidoglycan-associated protein
MAGGAPGGTQAFASTLTDLMTSLAVIFILLVVVFLKQVHDQGHKAREAVKDGLSSYLEQKQVPVKSDSDDPLSLTVMLGELHLQFPKGRAYLTAEGKAFTREFFKSFADKVCAPVMRAKIDSITVEGHTDTSGEQTVAGVRRNIDISQRRAYAVLEQGLRALEPDPELYECMLVLASASGRGSRRPVMINGLYSPDQSRRVEIKIRVKSSSGAIPPPPPLPPGPRRRRGK